jgi:hypothetical protein
LHSWLLAHELTAVLTAKLDWLEKAAPMEDGALQYLPFIVDCVVALTHKVESGFSRRRVRVIKYRGSSFSENETPFVIGQPLAGEQDFSRTALKITTVADTWIYLSFSDGGERNRGLTIIKSRGTNHSNQVRELILASSGLSLAPPYTADGNVLMGTMRWQKERAEGEERARLNVEFERQHAAIDGELAELGARLQTLQRDIATRRLAQSSMAGTEQLRHREEELRHAGMIRLRQSGELGSAEATQLAPTRETAVEENRP